MRDCIVGQGRPFAQLHFVLRKNPLLPRPFLPFFPLSHLKVMPPSLARPSFTALFLPSLPSSANSPRSRSLAPPCGGAAAVSFLPPMLPATAAATAYALSLSPFRSFTPACLPRSLPPTTRESRRRASAASKLRSLRRRRRQLQALRGRSGLPSFLLSIILWPLPPLPKSRHCVRPLLL